jgi:carbon-monoxide dehydrogenase iron sulfur subunit
LKGTIKVNVEKCMGCQRCRLACFVEHSQSKNLLGAIREAQERETRPWSNMHIRKVGVVSVPTSCHHCPAAVCMAACPTGAMFRTGPNEPVMVDNDLCVGCGNCVIVCPYGVPQLTPDHSHIQKCDQCVERVREGLEPACVEACPTGCLEFVVEGEEAEEAAGAVMDLYRRILESQSEVEAKR